MNDRPPSSDLRGQLHDDVIGTDCASDGSEGFSVERMTGRGFSGDLIIESRVALVIERFPTCRKRTRRLHEWTFVGHEPKVLVTN